MLYEVQTDVQWRSLVIYALYSWLSIHCCHYTCSELFSININFTIGIKRSLLWSKKRNCNKNILFRRFICINSFIKFSHHQCIFVAIVILTIVKWRQLFMTNELYIIMFMFNHSLGVKLNINKKSFLVFSNFLSILSLWNFQFWCPASQKP